MSSVFSAQINERAEAKADAINRVMWALAHASEIFFDVSVFAKDRLQRRWIGFDEMTMDKIEGRDSTHLYYALQAILDDRFACEPQCGFCKRLMSQHKDCDECELGCAGLDYRGDYGKYICVDCADYEPEYDRLRVLYR